MYPFPEKLQTICAKRYLHRPAYCAATRVCCHHLISRRAFLFSTRSPSVCGKPFRFFSRFPVVTRSAFLFLPTSCPCSRKVYRNFQLFHALFIRSSFLFFMIESIGGPYYRPQLEELLCTKPNSRATPKRRPALYMP